MLWSNLMKEMSAWTRTQVLTAVMLSVLVSYSGWLPQATCLAAEPGNRDISSSEYHLEFLTFKASHPSQTVVEMFCQYPVDEPYRSHRGELKGGRYDLTVTLYDEARQCVDSLATRDSVSATPNETWLPVSNSHLKRFAFNVAPGRYLAHVEIGALGDARPVTFERQLSVSDYSRTGLQISDLQLASAAPMPSMQPLRQDVRSSITPNLSRIFGLEYQTLNVYAEVYNLAPATDSIADALALTCTIQDLDQHILRREKHRFTIPGNTAAFRAAMPVGELPTGTYTLLLEIRDPQTGETRSKETTFHVINPWAFISDDSYRQFVRQLAYSAEPEEIQALLSLPESERIKGLQVFWAGRDPDPTTAGNEFMQAYLKRIYMTNTYFDDLTCEGWQTERGEVYIENGPPDRIERVVSTVNSKLYEVWKYRKLRRKFVFVDNWGLGSYQLLKSVSLLEPLFGIR